MEIIAILIVLAVPICALMFKLDRVTKENSYLLASISEKDKMMEHFKSVAQKCINDYNTQVEKNQKLQKEIEQLPSAVRMINPVIVKQADTIWKSFQKEKEEARFFKESKSKTKPRYAKTKTT